MHGKCVLENACAGPVRAVRGAVMLVTGKACNYAAEQIRVLRERYLEVNETIVNLKFPGRGQRPRRELAMGEVACGQCRIYRNAGQIIK